MNELNRFSVVLGNDHKNTLGTVQSLGQAGINSIAVCWGSKTGIVKSSKFTKKVFYAATADDCIEVLLNYSFTEKADSVGVITPCCDEAAVVLDRHRETLQHRYRFEFSSKYSLDELSEKNLQVELAQKAGLCIPEYYTIRNINDLPNNPPLPCIIKPLVSMKGSKADLRVCYDTDELKKNAIEVLPHNQGLILQKYIDKECEYLVECCRYADGTCVAPIIIKNTRLYPEKVGLSIFHEVIPFDDCDLKRKIFTLLDLMGYVGLVSVEFAKSAGDEKNYFFEFNIRNDGYNPCATKSGANINYAYFCDMLEIDKPELKAKHIFVISEIKHFMAFLHRKITLKEWINDIRISNAYTWYYKNDKRPFYALFKHLFTEVIKDRIGRIKRR